LKTGLDGLAAADFGPEKAELIAIRQEIFIRLELPELTNRLTLVFEPLYARKCELFHG
jgi:hypothetical protein